MSLTTLYGVTLTVEVALSAATGASSVISPNPYFETDASGWTGVNGAVIDQSSAQAYEGLASLRITPDGVTAVPQVQSDKIPVMAGALYLLQGMLRSAGSGTRTLNIFWFNSSDAFLSSSAVSHALTAAVWTQYVTAATAPAGATYARVTSNDPGTPAAANSWRIDAVTMSTVGGFGAWGASVWDGATWGPDETWVDVSDYVRSVSTQRSLSRDAQCWNAGTATIVLDNRDARFTAANLTGPYVTAGVTGIRPWRPVRVRAAWAGVTYAVYRGYALAWTEGYVQPFPNGGDAFVTLSCEDEWSALGRFDGLAQGAVGASEMSGERIHRILDNAGYAGSRMIDSGNNTMQATTLNLNAVADLKLTTDSEGGGLFIARDGTVTFERSTALVENTRSNTIQATFGDSAAELAYSSVTPSYDGSLTANIASWSRVGGAVQTVTDETSRALYRDKRNTRSDLMCETDGQAAVLASFFVQKYSTPEDRIDSIQVLPRYSPSLLFPVVLGREVRDLVRVVRRPPGAITVTRDGHVAGISHQITKDNWVTTFQFWSAAVYQGVGRWDVATWDTSRFFF